MHVAQKAHLPVQGRVRAAVAKRHSNGSRALGEAADSPVTKACVQSAVICVGGFPL